MPERVDAGVERVQATGPHGALDLPRVEAESEEVAPADEPELLLRKRHRSRPGGLGRLGPHTWVPRTQTPRQGELQRANYAERAAASSACRSSMRRIFPVSVLGRSATNSILRG